MYVWAWACVYAWTGVRAYVCTTYVNSPIPGYKEVYRYVQAEA